MPQAAYAASVVDAALHSKYFEEACGNGRALFILMASQEAISTSTLAELTMQKRLLLSLLTQASP